MPQLAEPARARLRATTSLPPTRVRQLGQKAAARAKGDFWNGRQRMTRARSTAKADVYEIHDALGSRTLMTLRLVAESKDGRTNVRVDVDDAVYVKPSRITLMTKPRVLAAHTLRQFLTALADAVRAADPDANVKVREDLMP